MATKSIRLIEETAHAIPRLSPTLPKRYRKIAHKWGGSHIEGPEVDAILKEAARVGYLVVPTSRLTAELKGVASLLNNSWFLYSEKTQVPWLTVRITERGIAMAHYDLIAHRPASGGMPYRVDYLALSAALNACFNAYPEDREKALGKVRTGHRVFNVGGMLGWLNFYTDDPTPFQLLRDALRHLVSEETLRSREATYSERRNARQERVREAQLAVYEAKSVEEIRERRRQLAAVQLQVAAEAKADLLRHERCRLEGVVPSTSTPKPLATPAAATKKEAPMGKRLDIDRHMANEEKEFLQTWHRMGERLAEQQRRETAMRPFVRLYKEGDSMAVQTNCDNEQSFLDHFTEAMSKIIEDGKYEGDWEFQLRHWIRQGFEIMAKLRGYKSDVQEERVITAGSVLVNPLDLVIDTAEGSATNGQEAPAILSAVSAAGQIGATQFADPFDEQPGEK